MPFGQITLSLHFGSEKQASRAWGRAISTAHALLSPAALSWATAAALQSGSLHRWTACKFGLGDMAVMAGNNKGRFTSRIMGVNAALGLSDGRDLVGRVVLSDPPGIRTTPKWVQVYSSY